MRILCWAAEACSPITRHSNGRKKSPVRPAKRLWIILPFIWKTYLGHRMQKWIWKITELHPYFWKLHIYYVSVYTHLYIYLKLESGITLDSPSICLTSATELDFRTSIVLCAFLKILFVWIQRDRGDRFIKYMSWKRTNTLGWYSHLRHNSVFSVSQARRRWSQCFKQISQQSVYRHSPAGSYSCLPQSTYHHSALGFAIFFTAGWG